MGYVDKEGVTSAINLNDYPCLVLNADYQPLSYLPLSLWPWQDAVKAVFLDRVNVVDNYNKVIRSANYKMMAPSVVSLKDYVSQKPTKRELEEKLEQLRVTENTKISITVIDEEILGVDTKEDFVAIKKIMEYKSK